MGERNILTGKFIADSKIPHVEEIDLGNGIRQLVIRYKDEEIIDKPKQLHIIPFLPKERIIDMEPVKSKEFSWHDFWIYVVTSAPILFTVIFADFLSAAHALIPMGLASIVWFWFVFLVNTKFQK